MSNSKELTVKDFFQQALSSGMISSKEDVGSFIDSISQYLNVSHGDIQKIVNKEAEKAGF